MTALVFFDDMMSLPVINANGVNPSALRNYFTYEFWENQSSSSNVYYGTNLLGKFANAICLARHNLGDTGAKLTVSYSLNTVEPLNFSVVFSHTFTNNDVTCLVFPRNFGYHWYISIDRPVKIAVMSLYDSLQLERGVPFGHKLANLMPQHKSINQISENGNYLGRVSKPNNVKTTISQPHMTEQWARQKWQPFLERASKQPFFFAWNHDEYPQESLLCWSQGGIISPKTKAKYYVHHELSVEGFSK